MSSKFFITSSGTGVGKTLITSALAYQLAQKGERVAALKPVISGFKQTDKNNDTAQLLASLDLPYDRAHIDAISPWRFKSALSPNMAAKQETKELPFADLIQFCELTRLADHVLVEGVGGVMTPLDNKHTVLDWMVALHWPVVMVVGSYLGSLSHTITACEAVRARGLTIAALIVSESENSEVDFKETCLTLKKFVPYAKRHKAVPRVSGRIKWQKLVDLTRVIA